MAVADASPAHDRTAQTAEARTRADASYERYMHDVHRYLTHVKSDRVHFRQRDVFHPRFAQHRDEGLPFRNPRPVHRLEHDCGPAHPQQDAFFAVLNWFRGRSSP